MVSSAISMRKSYKAECRDQYKGRLHLGTSSGEAVAYVYAWHEEGEPHECKIGYCSKDPFEYLWDGPTLSHQKRIPVLFLTIGAQSVRAAKLLEGHIHTMLESKHMQRSCAREWFVAHRDEVCECAKAAWAIVGATSAI